ncbi:hypothetical protein [Quadrisphaera setariae]|uniref:Uncharacterized protein n=1 Tax=Quadrisphaera setariae TaxID=2593304 RepID=A0A5C8Z2U8_9ACTN|nr:hypothetical protein [Quadrisphaera setariae]TXR51579.1 hypothetical protein FMM08_22280 [Quadrisphaera setariae]
MSSDLTARAHRGARWKKAAPWTHVRLLLVLAWLVLTVTAMATGQRHSSYADLQAAIASGAVHHVSVTADLPAGSTGSALVEVSWREGWTKRIAEFRQVRGLDAGSVSSQDGEPVIHGDLDQVLRADRPDLVITRGERPGTWSDLLGWRVSIAVGLTALALGLAQTVVLIAGPAPWWATRWAWFWLSWTWVGTLAFLLLAGPTPGVRIDGAGRRRLGGWWALLIAVVVGSVFSAGSI